MLSLFLRCLLTGGLCCVSACHTTSPSGAAALQRSKEAESFQSSIPPTLLLANYPLSVTARRTTSEAIFLDHLDGQIDQARASEENVALAGKLFQRYQIKGHMQDLDQAYQLAKAAANDGDEMRPEALLIWATIAAYLHQFEDADAAIASLDSKFAKNAQALTAQIRAARGENSRTAMPDSLPEGAEFEVLIDQAHQCVDLGDLTCASQHYHQAQFFYHDSAPLPLAWLHTLQGIALLRFGHAEWALKFFDAALQRMPSYYLAAEHRAECLFLLGRLEASREAYLSVIEQTGGLKGNPEFMAALSEVSAALGKHNEAKQWREQAMQSFNDRIARYPDAFAAHAIDFFLSQKQFTRAKLLAENNLRIRQDVGSYIALAEVMQAMNDHAGFCQAYQRAIASPWQPPELQALSKSKFAVRCRA